MGLCKLWTSSPPNCSSNYPFPFFFLPSFPPELLFLTLSFSLSLHSASLSKLLSQGLYWSQGKRLSGSSWPLFSPGQVQRGWELCMSEPPLPRLHSALPLPLLFTKTLLCKKQDSREKKEGSPFSLFVLHIALQAFPKPLLMSWPPPCCERREKQVREREKVWLIWAHSLHWWHVSLVFISLLGGFALLRTNVLCTPALEYIWGDLTNYVFIKCSSANAVNCFIESQ